MKKITISKYSIFPSWNMEIIYGNKTFTIYFLISMQFLFTISIILVLLYIINNYILAILNFFNLECYKKYIIDISFFTIK